MSCRADDLRGQGLHLSSFNKSKRIGFDFVNPSSRISDLRGALRGGRWLVFVGPVSQTISISSSESSLLACNKEASTAADGPGRLLDPDEDVVEVLLTDATVEELLNRETGGVEAAIDGALEHGPDVSWLALEGAQLMSSQLMSSNPKLFGVCELNHGMHRWCSLSSSLLNSNIQPFP